MSVSGRNFVYAGLLIAIAAFSLSAVWNFSYVQQTHSDASAAHDAVFWQVVSLERETLRFRTVLQENIGSIRADKEDLTL